MLRTFLRIALPLAAQQGLKSTFGSLRRQAALLLAAAFLLGAAFVFGLIAVYALLRGAGFPVEGAAGILAGALAGTAVLMLAVNAYRNKRGTSRFKSSLSSMSDSSPLEMADQQANKLMRKVGPVSLLAAAFAIGLTVARRK